MTYCNYITTISGDQLSLHKEYHYNHYGFPIDKDEELFEKNFKFTGGEIVYEFLVSTGYLPGAHSPQCPVYGRIKQLNQNK
jgi:DNA-3-methyladenine glycosylase I